MYRKAWIGYVAAFAVVLAGFWPSLYSHAGAGLDWLHIAHGLLATSWMLLVIVQGWLIGYRHNRIHRKLGWVSVVIVPLFLISGLVMEHTMFAAKDGLPFDTAIKLVWLDLWTLTVFGVLFVMALVTRKRVVDHARYVTATVIILLPPAIGRLLAAPMHGLDPTLLPITIMLSLLVAALMISDWRSRKLIHPAYLAVIALLVGTCLTYPLTTGPAGHAVGRWFAAL